VSWHHYGWGPGGWLIASLLWVAFWVAVVLVIVALVRNRHHDHHHGDPSTPALRVLEERYARGEISREEFLERRAVLSGQGPFPPPPAGPSPTQEL